MSEIFIYQFLYLFPFYRRKIIYTFVAAQSGSNESERMLPFNVWITFPVTRTPYYEIIFFIQVI